MSFFMHSGLRALGVAMVASIGLGACGGSGSANDDLPLIRATISIKTVSQGGICESVRVRVMPKQLIGQANKYANNRTMVTEVKMTGPTDENGAPMCNGTGETLPVAPGIWEFSAPLASGSVTCRRDIEADGDLLIVLIDGVDGCGSAGGASAAPAAGETPAEGGAPAEPADTTPPAGG